MGFPGFFTPMFAWLFLLLGPLVLFYYLKLKRPRMTIPSLVLWRQVMRDNRVNSPFQRFKRNILLLLQILLLTLLVLAAMQPFWRGGEQTAERLPILIDRSASMAAIGAPDGPTRLDLAKEQAGRIIDNMSSNQQVSLITFGRSARQLTGFTSNKRVLSEALRGIKIEDVPSALDDALRMVEAMARSKPFDRVLLLSDGNVPGQVDFALPYKLDYRRVPPAGANMGVTDLGARRAFGGESGGEGGWSVFVQVQATDDQPMTGTLQLIQDGRLVAQEPIAPRRAQSQRLMFTVNAAAQTRIEVRIVPRVFDALESDNRAFMVLTPPRPLDVYIPPTLAAYRHAMQGFTGVRMYPAAGVDTAPGDYDVLISDNAKIDEVRARTNLYVGVVPGDLRDMLDVAQAGDEFIDWRRSSRLLDHIELSDVVLLDEVRWQDGAGEEALENQGYEVLAYGRNGPLILRKREGETLSYHLLFHTDRSTLPYRIGFPILVANLTRIAMQEAGLLEVIGDRTGVMRPVALAVDTTYRITGPDGYAREERTDEQGRLLGVPAPRVGIYRLKGGDGDHIEIGVSLLQGSETLMTTAQEIHFRELSVAVTASPMRVNRSLWPTLATMALAVLLVEWWFYQKRPGGRNV